MKQIKSVSFLTILLVIITSCHNSENLNITLLSDQIPTDTPLFFGEGIIWTESYEFAITFSPEMDEMYFTRRKPEKRNNILVAKLVDEKWSKPELVFFSSEATWDFEPHINPQGGILYYGSNTPDGEHLFFHRGVEDHEDIYWVEFRSIKENLFKKSNRY